MKPWLSMIKIPLFPFVASIFQSYLVIFKTNSAMIPFMFSELEKIFNQLITLLFRKYAIDQSSTVSKKIKKEWLTNKQNCLEDGLVDVGSATRYLLQQAKISAEKRRSFKGDYKKMIIDILFKVQENTPLQHNSFQN